MIARKLDSFRLEIRDRAKKKIMSDLRHKHCLAQQQLYPEQVEKMTILMINARLMANTPNPNAVSLLLRFLRDHEDLGVRACLIDECVQMNIFSYIH